MMEKMMTFEEWNSRPGESTLRDAWETARIGTIPAENAVVIPPVVEWPKWATGVRMVFEEGGAWNTPGSTDVSSTSQMIKTVPGTFIPRPKLVWVPKVGEAVFTNGIDDEGVLYAVVTEVVPGEGVYVMFPDGLDGEYDFDRVKPGNMKYFGKPWSEIPGGC